MMVEGAMQFLSYLPEAAEDRIAAVIVDLPAEAQDRIEAAEEEARVMILESQGVLLNDPYWLSQHPEEWERARQAPNRAAAHLFDAIAKDLLKTEGLTADSSLNAKLQEMVEAFRQWDGVDPLKLGVLVRRWRAAALRKRAGDDEDAAHATTAADTKNPAQSSPPLTLKKTGRPRGVPINREKLLQLQGSMTQANFAKKCNLSVDTIQSSHWSETTIRSVAQRLNVPEEDLKLPEPRK
jgi:DNA-binding transcriptional regulator YiaG